MFWHTQYIIIYLCAVQCGMVFVCIKFQSVELATSQCQFSSCNNRAWISPIRCSSDVDSLLGQRIAMFSYGSGSASTFFSLKITSEASKSLVDLQSSLMNLTKRLESRHQVTPALFTEKMEAREKVYNKGMYRWSLITVWEFNHFRKFWYGNCTCTTTSSPPAPSSMFMAHHQGS